MRRIPEGKVATYGQVAALAGFPRHARSVGYALSALGSAREAERWEGQDLDQEHPDQESPSTAQVDESSVPWQRVVNAQGRVSARASPGFEGLQEEILRQEGVEIRVDGSIDLERFRWRPRPRSASKRSME